MKEFEIFFNTYNARHLNPREVAQTFIWSINYEKLIQNNHSVILGARGCGKTTLMKMLTLPALYSWKGEEAEKARQNIPFYSIYISTDIYWDVKNQTYNTQLKKFGNFSDVISAFAVNSNVFKATCETLKNIIEYELKDNDEKKEIELCQALIKAWKLNSALPKIDYVIDALNERIDEVNQYIQYVIFNNKDQSQIQNFDYFNLSFETSIEYIIPIFERIYGIKTSKKWALCFDELEFAPLWLQKKLFISLRSRTQYILYKLSASPILPIELENSIMKEYGATPGNDVQIIKMWSSGENETFSRKIVESIFKRNNISISPEEYFGSNDLYNKNQNSYNRDSEFYHEMKELVAKDISFRNFLLANEVNVNDPVPKNDRQKDTLFRKIKPIVYYRNFYIEKNDDTLKEKPALRSRKTSELYSGIEILCKICDGNPRWLIGIVNSILVKSKEVKASPKVQYHELQIAAKRFANVIANIPIPNEQNSQYNLVQLIDKIGQFFCEQVLGTTFNLDPKGTFIVDESKTDTPDSIIKLIEKGTAQGAFILLDSEDDRFDFVIRGQRFKLAYLFSLLYKLPLRKYTSIKLSECLKDVSITQGTLFQI